MRFCLETTCKVAFYIKCKEIRSGAEMPGAPIPSVPLHHIPIFDDRSYEL